MPPIIGMRGTDQLAPEQKYIEMADKIKMLVPDETPFTTFLQQLSQVSAPAGRSSRPSKTTSCRASTRSSAPVAPPSRSTWRPGTKFRPNDIIIATRTGEQMRRRERSTVNALTVTRGQTPVALIDTDEILIAGSAQPEGDLRRIPVSANPVPLVNYTQILRRSWELTGTAYASENETDPHDWDYQAAKVGIEHKRDIERTLLFGVALEGRRPPTASRCAPRAGCSTGSRPTRWTPAAASPRTSSTPSRGPSSATAPSARC